VVKDLSLVKVEEFLEKAGKAETLGNMDTAREYYLLASQQLFYIAAESTDKLKEIRLANAEKLVQKAKSLPNPEKIVANNSKSGPAVDFILKEIPDVTFDDVAGLDNVKEEIKNKIIYPFQFPEQAKKFGIKTGGGMLLYGPPGTGKTYIAKAVAHEVKAVFFNIQPSDVMSKWVGESEQNIAKLFTEARQQTKSIIFIDEVEALIPKRKDSGSTIMQRVVPQILAEMEGMESKKDNLLFIGATNEPWSIDHAALRPGRFDEKIYVPPPDLPARIKLFQLNLKGRLQTADIDPNKLAELTEGYSGADIKQICLKAALIPFREVIRGDAERGINMADLQKVLEDVKPSISPLIIEKYEIFKFA
jgi:transitional endoplasmic reticulum ATPase